MTARQALQTPWGPADGVEPVAVGIDWVNTPRHGGLRLGAARWAQLKEAFPDWQPFNGNVGWLEEDCDWAVAAILWPAEFPAESVFYAVRQVTAQPDYYKSAERWLYSPPGITARTIAKHYATLTAGLWERGGLGTAGHGWHVDFRRGDERQTRIMPDYPVKTWWSDAELAEFPRLPEPPPIAKPAAPVTLRPTADFSEVDCGGAFDGFRVTSDADPGL